MASIKKSIDVAVPVRTAYDQWTQFEEFPRFMDGVEEVQQLDDKRLHWKATVGGKLEEWDAEIFEQRPDEIISWRSTTGAKNAGTVTFQPGEKGAVVSMLLEYEPEGAVEKAGDALGFRGPSGQELPGSVQEVHRVTPHRDRSVARDYRGRQGRGAHGAHRLDRSAGTGVDRSRPSSFSQDRSGDRGSSTAHGSSEGRAARAAGTRAPRRAAPTPAANG